MELKFERIFSDAEFEVTAIGAWQFTRWSGGEPFWQYVGTKQWTTKSWERLTPKNKPGYLRKKRVA